MPDSAMDPSTCMPAGGGQPHNNLPPCLVLNFVIALTGIFPSRN
jgi:microcystin-dependent protein